MIEDGIYFADKSLSTGEDEIKVTYEIDVYRTAPDEQEFDLLGCYLLGTKIDIYKDCEFGSCIHDNMIDDVKEILNNPKKFDIRSN